MKASRETVVLVMLPLAVLAGALAFLIPSAGSDALPGTIAAEEASVTPLRSVVVPVAAQAAVPTAVAAAEQEPLQAESEIQGEVRNASGQPVAGAKVLVQARPNMLDGQGASLLPLSAGISTTSDALGRFRFAPVGLALYDIVITAAGYAVEVLTVQHGAPLLATLHVPSTVSGVVTDENSAPIGRVVVSLVQGMRRETCETDSLGHFRFEQVSSGIATLEFAHANYEPQLVRLPAILEGERIERRVTLLSGQELRGHVTDLNGLPVGGATVAAVDQLRMLSCGSVQTDSAGAFRIRAVRAGAYYRLNVVHASGSAAIDVVTPESGASDEVQVLLEEPWALVGYTVGTQGQPIASAHVTLTSTGGATRSMLSDVNGRFCFDELIAGMSYRVVGVAAGCAVTQVNGIQQTLAPLWLQLEPAASLAGVVTDVSGQGLQGAAVRFTYVANPQAPVFTLTAPDGTWQLGGMPSGLAWMTVMRAGFVQSVMSIEIAAPARAGQIETVLAAQN